MGLYAVTGVAGFIGSHLAEQLVAEGHRVLGIDRLSGSPSSTRFKTNLERLSNSDAFCLLRKELLDLTAEDLPEDIDTVFHLAGRAGVRPSWEGLEAYLSDNVLATQRILEILVKIPVRRLILTSSSSVYGDGTPLPAQEDGLLGPMSPYAVSKLAAEALCLAYWRNFGVPAVILRYFTVYGPRQRPDMAFSRFARALHRGEAIPVIGDGLQRRDFTFIDDAVHATILASNRASPGEIFNVSGGWEVSLIEVIDLLEELTGKRVAISWRGPGKGESRRTWGDIARARSRLGYQPKTDLREGLGIFLEWFREEMSKAAGSAREGRES